VGEEERGERGIKGGKRQTGEGKKNRKEEEVLAKDKQPANRIPRTKNSD